MNKKTTKEPQYNILFDTAKKHGVSKFGLMSNESWNIDPKRTLFTLARYKFVAKLLAGKKNVLAPENIRKILETYTNRATVEFFSRLVDHEDFEVFEAQLVRRKQEVLARGMFVWRPAHRAEIGELRGARAVKVHRPDVGDETTLVEPAEEGFGCVRHGGGA